MEEIQNIPKCKVVLLGESGVGKTSIISILLNKAFNEKELSTIGALYAGKTMRYDEYPDKSVNFELWDTTGMEIYRTLTSFFYWESEVVILVYDITRKETFDQIKNYWYNEVKERCKNENLSK